MKREIYGSKRIPRDPDKVDESYNYIRQREQQYADMVIEAEVVENGNATPINLPEEPKAIEEPPSYEEPPEEVAPPDDLSADPNF